MEVERRLQRAEELGTPATGRQAGFKEGAGPGSTGRGVWAGGAEAAFGGGRIPVLGQQEGVGTGPSPSHWGACSCPPPGPAAQGGAGGRRTSPSAQHSSPVAPVSIPSPRLRLNRGRAGGFAMETMEGLSPASPEPRPSSPVSTRTSPASLMHSVQRLVCVARTWAGEAGRAQPPPLPPQQLLGNRDG